MTASRVSSQSNGTYPLRSAAAALTAVHASSARPEFNRRRAISAATFGTVLRLLGLLGDEGVDVALCVSDCLKRKLDGDVAAVSGDLIGIDRAGGRPADPLALRIGRRLDRRARQFLDPGFQVLEAGRAERRREQRDQIIILAVAVVLDGDEHLVGERHRFGPGCGRQFGEVGAGRVEHPDHRSTRIVAPVKDRFRQFREAPHQIECLGGILRRDLFEDGPALGLEVVHQRLARLPVHEGAGPRDRRQPLPDLARHLLRALRARKLQPQPPLDGGVPGADLHQERGERFRAERLEVLRVEGLLRCHAARYRSRASVGKAGEPASGGEAPQRLSSKIVFVRHRQLRHREGFTQAAVRATFGARSGEARADGERRNEGQGEERASTL
jgi:hypothetical protein